MVLVLDWIPERRGYVEIITIKTPFSNKSTMDIYLSNTALDHDKKP